MRGARRIGGGRGIRGGPGKDWVGYLPHDLRAFGNNTDQWANTAHDEGEWRKTATQVAERFMVKWIAAEKVRARLRHAVPCSNVPERTNGMIARSKRVRPESFVIAD